MLKHSKKKVLAERIADVLNVAPSSYDPEDEILDSTTPNTLEDVDENIESDEEKLLSKFRRQNIDLLEDVDIKYAGKKSSRKDLQNSDIEDDQEEDSQIESEDEGDSSDSISNKSEDVENEESEENLESDDSEDVDEGSGEEYSDVEDADNDDESFKHMNDNHSSQVKKGQCVRNQMSIWENLLEIRIQLQKCLLAANKMPQRSYYQEIKKESGNNFQDKVMETKKSVSNALDKMLTFQKLMLKKYPETKKIVKSNENTDAKEASDEEIPSDTEDEQENISESEEEDTIPKKKIKLQEYEKDIGDLHSKYKSYRNSTIDKWNNKTRIAVLKNNTNSYTVLNQIEHHLSDKEKLIKRSQLKKSNYDIIGENTEDDKPEDESKTHSVEEYNTNVFDDDDFYHQLLRELIEVKSADITDPVQLGRQWIQLQNMRSKMKRKIDTRATKGRKIRYAVHSKLVNFMAPMDDNGWTDEAKNELYGSLFGKKYSSVSA